MSDNPYQTPASEPKVIGVLSGTREDLRNVAKFQKGILVCILVYLISIVLQFFIPPNLRIVLGLAVLVAALAGTVFVFMLAMKVYGTGLGILCGVLTLIPCVGLIVLLAVNAKATSILKENGFEVGLMGADLSRI